MICNICLVCKAPFEPQLLKIYGRHCSFECQIKYTAFCIEVNEMLYKFYKPVHINQNIGGSNEN